MYIDTEIELLSVDIVRSMPVVALANVYPLLHGEEAVDLARSVNKNGIREPLVIFEDQLLDGRNRIVAASKAELEVVPVRRFVGTIEEAEDLIIDLNEKRRHLTPGQRAVIADEHRGIVEARASIRKAATQFGADPENLPAPDEEVGDTRTILSKKHNVNEKYIDNVKKLRRIADEKMLDQFQDDGDEVPTPRAQKARAALTQLRDGKTTMNAVATSLLGGNVGQLITSDVDPLDAAIRDASNAFSAAKLESAIDVVYKADPGQARDAAINSIATKAMRYRIQLNEIINRLVELRWVDGAN